MTRVVHDLLAAASPVFTRTAARVLHLQGDEGQTFAEYELLLALVVLVAVVGFTQLGPALSSYITTTVNALVAWFS